MERLEEEAVAEGPLGDGGGAKAVGQEVTRIIGNPPLIVLKQRHGELLSLW